MAGSFPAQACATRSPALKTKSHNTKILELCASRSHASAEGLACCMEPRGLLRSYIHTYIHTYIQRHTHTHTHGQIRTYMHTYVHAYVATTSFHVPTFPPIFYVQVFGRQDLLCIVQPVSCTWFGLDCDVPECCQQERLSSTSKQAKCFKRCCLGHSLTSRFSVVGLWNSKSWHL